MSANLTMLLPEVAGDAQSLATMATMASTIFWGAVELIVSICFISGYSFMLCYAVGLVMRNEQSLEHSNDPDLPNKEQTCALMLTGFLGGIHVMMVFYGIPFLGHDSDSFLMKLMFSCALLAAATTAIIIGGVMLYLIVPALWSCVASLFRRCSGASKALDVEEMACEADLEAKMPFLEKVDSIHQ